jgi:hypothetical protein
MLILLLLYTVLLNDCRGFKVASHTHCSETTESHFTSCKTQNALCSGVTIMYPASHAAADVCHVTNGAHIEHL